MGRNADHAADGAGGPRSVSAAQPFRAIIAALCLFYLIAALPLLLGVIPPLGDYLNHLARMHVILAGGRDPWLAQFYAVHWALIPNLAIDLLVPPLAKVVGLFWAGKLFVLSPLRSF